MKVKVEDLSGATLDLAVAICEELPLRHDPMGFGNCSEGGYWVWDERNGFLKAVYKKIGREYSPSTNWAQGGPIIERKMFSLETFKGRRDNWQCFDFKHGEVYQGTTPLIAAMRCYVAIKFGETIDIPEF